MDTNKMREQFEEWAKDRYSWHLHDDARDPEDRTLASWNGETYGNRIVEGMWQAWQASREAVVVDITWFTCLVPGGNPLEVIDACRAKVEAQGLRVTP
jgi:selenophosphate synthetase-related protein